MADKALGIASLALCAASQAFIRHTDTALFFSLVFGAVGVYELLVGEMKQRKGTA
jgi:hypothetical protein